MVILIMCDMQGANKSRLILENISLKHCALSPLQRERERETAEGTESGNKFQCQIQVRSNKSSLIMMLMLPFSPSIERRSRAHFPHFFILYFVFMMIVLCSIRSARLSRSCSGKVVITSGLMFRNQLFNLIERNDEENVAIAVCTIVASSLIEFAIIPFSKQSMVSLAPESVFSH
jgi:hypothetical protein